MKSCPACQRTFPDNSPDACPYDGTHLVGSAAPPPTQPYNAGGQQAPQYGAPGNQPPAPQWPPQPPPQNYGGYQPQGQYSPPANPYGRKGGGGLAKAALITGILAIVAYGVAEVIARTASTPTSMEELDSLLTRVGIFALAGLILGGIAIILGIITLILANKNPALSKAQGAIGLILGAIPIILYVLNKTGVVNI